MFSCSTFIPSLALGLLKVTQQSGRSLLKWKFHLLLPAETTHSILYGRAVSNTPKVMLSATACSILFRPSRRRHFCRAMEGAVRNYTLSSCGVYFFPSVDPWSNASPRCRIPVLVFLFFGSGFLVHTQRTPAQKSVPPGVIPRCPRVPCTI